MRNLGNQNSYHPWSDEEIKNLIKLSESNKTIEEMSIILNRPYESVKQKLRKIKIKAKPLRNNIWSKDEELLLEDLWSRNLSTKNIAKRLNRSEGAVKQKAERMFLGERGYGDLRFTIPEIINSMGVKRDTVYSWLHRGLIATKTRYGKYLVSQKDLLNFLYDNQDKFDASKIEKGFIIPEPDWLTAKRKSDILSNKTKSKGDKYTPEDLSYMKLLIDKGYSNEVIAKRLNRTPIAIKIYRNKHKL